MLFHSPETCVFGENWNFVELIGAQQRALVKDMVGGGDIEVTTRPLHLFSLLVENWKGAEYSQILPPEPPHLRSEQQHPLVSCFLLCFFGKFLTRPYPSGSYWK